MTKVSVLASGLHIPESPRWHRGALHFVDGPSVHRLSADGSVEVVVSVECPILLGLDFASDGSILTNDAAGRRTMRVAPDGSVSVVADLSNLAATMLNEVTLLEDGSMFVGEIGFDVIAGAPPETVQLLYVKPDGTASRVGPQIAFANGMTDAPGGNGFYVAEFVEGAIWHVDTSTADPVFTRAVAGVGMGVDGIAIGPDEKLWYANMLGGQLYELDADGRKTREIATGFPHATSLAFAPDFSRVFATVVEQLPSPETMGLATGAVVAIDL
ncbi:SMP-30/gluconolactonase/LRE family protein [Novosphingobium aquimarinum]|uniref:SMP-30/gluconolactonase/LRE family protein n=1 Tax=Novosphingobium aquimarinum TaxID=2682494 RepID=UPI0012EBAA9B|nr:SMP-30/gluconolactonase/LRE family protein [Novosphingobium aquimarinum]